MLQTHIFTHLIGADFLCFTIPAGSILDSQEADSVVMGLIMPTTVGVMIPG